ncbi:fibrinogen-like protein A [Ciona intestinalis]
MLFSKNPKRKLNVIYKVCIASTPAHINATARPTNASLPHTFNVAVVDIQRYSVLVELERTDQKSGWDEISITVDWVSHNHAEELGMSSCKAYYDSGKTESGKFPLSFSDYSVVEVYCDGGWTVIQRRKDGSVDFYRNWANYTTGFGNLEGEHWLGLNTLHKLTTSNESYELRVDVTDCYNATKYAEYSTFIVQSAATNYRLNVGGYNGSAGDSLAHNNGYMFQTYDHNTNSHCVNTDRGGWWYNNCAFANLNGLYAPCASGEVNAGWYHFNNEHRGSKFIEMKIRPKK